MRKWTKSACVVLAGCSLSALVAAGVTGSVRSAQANHRTANSITQVILVSSITMTMPRAAAPQAAATARYVVQPGDTLSSIAGALSVRGGWQALYAANRPRVGANPNVILPGTVLVLPEARTSVRYTVAAGDTLSGIAVRLAVPGGWRALYAANRRAIGPDPDLVRPGAVLIPPGAAPSARSGHHHHQQPAPAPAKPTPAQPQPSAPAASNGPSPAGTQPPASAQSPAAAPASASGQSPRAARQPLPQTGTGGLPWWLELLLLAAGLLIVVAFLTVPIMMLGRRSSPDKEAAETARIVLADHERLIVTYSTADDTVYVLTPPGEDPRAVLRAARLVLPDDTYEVLAGRLGVPANWPLE